MPRVEEAAGEVRGERTLGASWALYMLARSVVLEAEEGRPVCQCLERLRGLVEEASGGMAPPLWVGRLVEEACRRGLDPGEAARRLLEYQSVALERIPHEALVALRGVPVVVTLSYSGTVERILQQLPQDTLVVVAESRPGGEGVELARRLAGAGRHVRVEPDTGLARWLEPGRSAVLIGADALTRDGCVYNKLGSRLLAHAARSIGAPVYAALDATKTVPEAVCGSLRVKTWSYEPQGWAPVEVPVLEPVEPRALSGLITEAGVLPPGSGSARLLAERLLALLD